VHLLQQLVVGAFFVSSAPVPNRRHTHQENCKHLLSRNLVVGLTSRVHASKDLRLSIKRTSAASMHTNHKLFLRVLTISMTSFMRCLCILHGSDVALHDRTPASYHIRRRLLLHYCQKLFPHSVYTSADVAMCKCHITSPMGRFSFLSLYNRTACSAGEQPCLVWSEHHPVILPEISIFATENITLETDSASHTWHNHGTSTCSSSTLAIIKLAG